MAMSQDLYLSGLQKASGCCALGTAVLGITRQQRPPVSWILT